MKVVTIGRSPENNVVVNDPHVSRVHLQIIQDDNGEYRIADFGSSNGTFVNGNRISGEYVIKTNDIIRIGNTTLPWMSYFRLSGGGFPPPPLPPAPPARERKGFVSFWLIFMIVVNTISVFFIILNNNDYYPLWYIISIAILSLIVVTAAILLLCWKKIGFWMVVGATGVAFIINIVYIVMFRSSAMYFHLSLRTDLQKMIMSILIISTVLGLVSAPILFAILQIKKNGVSAWKNLE